MGAVADRAVGRARPERVGGVLDHDSRPVVERGEIDGQPGVVHGDERVAGRRDRAEVEVQRRRVDVDEGRRGADVPRRSSALATNESGEVATLSPGPMPAAATAPCSAAVPLANATACCAPTRSAQRARTPRPPGPGQPVAPEDLRRPRRCRRRRWLGGRRGSRRRSGPRRRSSSGVEPLVVGVAGVDEVVVERLAVHQRVLRRSTRGARAGRRTRRRSSMAWRASSAVSSSSCSFSPGRMPMIVAGHAGGHRLGEVDDPHRRDLRDEDLAAVACAPGRAAPGRRPGQRDPEAGHALVGDREPAVSSSCSLEQRERPSPREPTTLP